MPDLSRQQRDLLAGLVTAVDRAAATSAPASGDHAWLTHVMRASDGSHYVAFSIAPSAPALPDTPVLVYVRLATAAAPGAVATTEQSIIREWLRGTRTDPRLLPRRGSAGIGDMPIFGSTGNFERRIPTTSGMTDLQLLDLERRRAQEKQIEQDRQRRAKLEGRASAAGNDLPFEDFEIATSARFADGTRAIQRALTAGPGAYDLYVAWVDAAQPADRAPILVARRPLRLEPAAAEFGLSSVIVADQIRVGGTPYSSHEQRAHPYAIGATSILPARDTIFTSAEQLSLAFQIVNPTPSVSGKPDIRVNLRIVRAAGLRDEPVAELSPLTYDATTLPDDFDVRLGYPLIAALSAPLATLARGSYRLMITAEDRLAGTVAGATTEFSVIGTPASLLAEAPAIGARPDHRAAIEPATVAALVDRLAPSRPSPVLTQALDSARAGRFADLLTATTVLPEEQAVRAALTGVGLLSIGDQNAGTHFQRALLLGAPAAPVEFLLGVVRAMQNRDADAITAWQSAVAGGMPPATVDWLVAAAYLRRNDPQRAAAAMTRPEGAASTRIWAATRIATHRETEAIAALDDWLAREPDDADARWLLLHALYARFVAGGHDTRDRLVSEARRYIDAKGMHAALAAEWMKMATSS